MYVAAKGNASQSPGAPVIVPNDPPNFKNCIAQVRKQIPTLAKTVGQAAQERLQPAVHLARQPGDGLPDQGLLVPGGGRPKLGIKVTDAQVQTGVQDGQEAAVPDRRRVPDVPHPVRPDDAGHPLPRPGQRDLQEAARQPPDDRHRRGDPGLLHSHTSQFGTPETRDIRIVRTKTQAAGEGRQGGARRRPELGRRRQEVLGRHRDQEQRRAADRRHQGRGGARRSTRPRSRRRRTRSSARSRASSATTCSRSTKIKPATQQTLAQATPLIKQILSGQPQTTAQTAVDKQAKKRLAEKTTCRSRYAMADCTGYKAPKTSTHRRAADRRPRPAPPTTHHRPPRPRRPAK